MAIATCPFGHEVTFSDPDPSFEHPVAVEDGEETFGTIEHHVVVVKCNALKTPNAPDATEAEIRANVELCGAEFEVALSDAAADDPEGHPRHTISGTV